MTRDNINGLILAGGRSERMGTNKAFIDYYGKPQYQYVYDLLKESCENVYISCKAAGEFPVEFNPLLDRFDLDSPINGIVSAFEKQPACVWLTAPVDMPLLDLQLIQNLIDHRDKEKMATCFWDSSGNSPEPLLTIWEMRAHSPLLKFLKSGGVSPRKFLQTHACNIIGWPDAKYLININTPVELATFRKTYM